MGALDILQQDTNPKHFSCFCKILEKKAAAGILSEMAWPAQPDLGPIELVQYKLNWAVWENTAQPAQQTFA